MPGAQFDCSPANLWCRHNHLTGTGRGGTRPGAKDDPITALRDYGIILADNGDSGSLIGTPDARWNDDLSCLRSLTLSDFEPVNVSSLIVNNDSDGTSH